MFTGVDTQQYHYSLHIASIVIPLAKLPLLLFLSAELNVCIEQ
jgi:hypothetical protein